MTPLPMTHLTKKPVLRENDIPLSPLLDKNVLIVGYGNQGRPQALNLRDSGIAVKAVSRPESRNRDQARADGMDLLSYEAGIVWADVLLMLLPDEVIAGTYQAAIAARIRPGQYLGFAHGLAVHAGWIHPDPALNVFLVAPKGQGEGVRNKYLQGSGVPGLYAVHQDPTGDTAAVALAYARAIGCGRAGILPTTFQEETECDLFSEQAVLCGGLTALIRSAFEVLVENGYSPEVAYFECLYEVKLIADLLHARGIAGMRQGISSTALYGDLSRGSRVVDSRVQDTLRELLVEITSGQFAREMKADFEVGKPFITEQLARDADHPIEQTYRRLKEIFKH